MIKQCAICGKSFETKGYTSKLTCSAACKYERDAQIQHLRYCQQRGYDILQHSYQRRARAGGTNKPLKPLVCNCCGKTFAPSYPKEKFCSDACRLKFFRPELINAFGKLFGLMD